MMKARDLINGPMGMAFILSAARLLPPATGYYLANLLGRRIANKHNSPMVQAVRTNQWVVSGCNLNSDELDRRTEAVFIQRGRTLYENYHFFRKRNFHEEMIHFDESFQNVIEHSQRRDMPQLLLLSHFGNFDLVAAAAASNGLTMQVLSYPNPGFSYRRENKQRKDAGYTVTPITVSSLRGALQNLRQGGTVLTGMDRPYGDFSLRPKFFGRTSNLPTGYIRLAINSNSPLVVIKFHISSGGEYIVSASDPIPVRRDADPVQEQLINIYNVLSVVEEMIVSNPEFWFMFYPVWPDLLKDTP
jgi:KDO2-lipid IV(A) lauroyltransferase